MLVARLCRMFPMFRNLYTNCHRDHHLRIAYHGRNHGDYADNDYYTDDNYEQMRELVRCKE